MPRARSAHRELHVWSNGVRIGAWRSGTRRMEFQYHDSWLSAPGMPPISLSLPLPIDDVPITGRAVEAYFDNLLPENEQIRRRLQERFQTTSRAAFDLLAAVGRDCIGAIQIVPADEAPARIDRIEADPLTESQVAAEISAATSARPPLREQHEFRISIAGAQEKTALLRHQGRWCRPRGSTPTTHIIKLPLGSVGTFDADMSTSVENEWLCARIATAFGLPVAKCEMAHFGPHKVLVVERFDRELHDSGKYWLRLMQEDFCQATGTPWHSKYQTDGGPGVQDLSYLLRSSVDAPRDQERLFKAQLLFYLLAALDGHAKNFSLRLLPGGRFHLTPLYDILSAWPVIGKRARELPIEKARLAMSLPGERPHYSHKSIQRRHFETLADRMGEKANAAAWIDGMLAQVDEVCERVQRGLPRDFPAQVLERILKGLKRSAAVLRQ
jgi:serine/threonine-protein kinase HipA